MAPSPRITAVIPTYCRRDLLRRTLQSVLAQTVQDLEIVVTDNASGDGTREMVEAFAVRDPRVRYFEQPENIGATRNFRFGWAQVRTPWMSFVSDDDALLPGFYAHALGMLERHPQARFFCGQTVTWNAYDGTHGLHPSKEWGSRSYAPAEATELMVRRPFTWTSCVFSTEVVRQLGRFSESDFEDIVFLARASARHPFVTSLRPCAVFTGWAQGFSHAVSPEETVARYEKTAEAICADEAVPPGLHSAIRAHLEKQPRSLLSRRMRRAFLDSTWPAFDAAADALEALGPQKASQRRMIRLGRGRQRHRWRVATARRLIRWHRAWRKRAKGAGGTGTFEEVAERYAGDLLGAGAADEAPAATALGATS